MITDLAYPEGIAIDPDGKTGWITQGFTGEVNRIDLASGTILASFDHFHDPQRIVLEPGGMTALVTDEHGEVIRLDLVSGKMEKILEHLSKPQGLALEGNGETVLVVEEEACSGAIARVDLRSNTKAWVVSGGCQLVRSPPAPIPVPLPSTPGGQFVYAGNYGADSISMYRTDRATGRLQPIASPVATGRNPYSIVKRHQFGGGPSSRRLFNPARACRSVPLPAPRRDRSK